MKTTYNGTVISVTKREKSTFAIFMSENGEKIEFFSKNRELLPFEIAEISVVKGYRHMFLSDYDVSVPSPVRAMPVKIISAAYFSELMKYVDEYGEKEKKLITDMTQFIKEKDFSSLNFENIEKSWLQCVGIYDSGSENTNKQICSYLDKKSIPLRDSVLKQFRQKV